MRSHAALIPISPVHPCVLRATYRHPIAARESPATDAISDGLPSAPRWYPARRPSPVFEARLLHCRAARCPARFETLSRSKYSSFFCVKFCMVPLAQPRHIQRVRDFVSSNIFKCVELAPFSLKLAGSSGSFRRGASPAILDSYLVRVGAAPLSHLLVRAWPAFGLQSIERNGSLIKLRQWSLLLAQKTALRRGSH